MNQAPFKCSATQDVRCALTLQAERLAQINVISTVAMHRRTALSMTVRAVTSRQTGRMVRDDDNKLSNGF